MKFYGFKLRTNVIFEFAININVGKSLTEMIKNNCGYHNRWYYKNLLGISTLFGMLSAIIGIDAAFWHIAWIAGVLFIVASIVSFIIYEDPFPDFEQIEGLRREEAAREGALE